ncbi:MAG: hypothetical protein K0U64_12090 [Actinomycetia bacterium]|nr:hypothetical protein [Actinomycetes bacterium]
MMTKPKNLSAILTAGAVLALSLSAPALTAVASASPDDSSGDSDEAYGICTQGARWQLEVEPEHSGSEVQWEIRSESTGQDWAYTIDAGSGGSFQGSATTSREGRWKVEKYTTGLSAGATVSATATNDATGETCTGNLTVGSSAGGSDDSGSDDNGRDDSNEDSNERERACATAATIRLKVKDRKNRVKVRFAVDSDDAGETWKYRMKRSGNTVLKGRARTQGSAAKFAVGKRLPKRGGKVFKVAANNRTDDDRCKVLVRQ